MSDEVWYDLGPGSNHPWWRTQQFDKVLARAWNPGDGLRCRAAANQKAEPCGPPVALVELQQEHAASWPYQPKTTRAIYCAGHLAGFFAERPVDMRLRVEKEAHEALIAAHWNEYQADYQARIESARNESLNCLPECLRSIARDHTDSK